jgi:putative transposase
MKPTFYDNGLKGVRGHYYHLRKALGRKKALRTIRKIGHTENRKVNAILHKISREIVDSAKETDSMIAFGKLTGIRKNGHGRRFNRKLCSFPYYRLAQYIKYKAKWEGIMVVEVPEAYTSKTCHVCGARGTRKAGLFRCSCVLHDDADRNGAINIGRRALGHVSNAGAVSEPARNLAEIEKNEIRDSAWKSPNYVGQ